MVVFWLERKRLSTEVSTHGKRAKYVYIYIYREKENKLDWNWCLVTC